MLIVMAYHVRLDGWDPRGWRRNQSTGTRLTFPPPRTVPRAARRAPPSRRESKEQAPPVVAPETKIRNLLLNGQKFGKWVWKWMK